MSDDDEDLDKDTLGRKVHVISVICLSDPSMSFKPSTDTEESNYL